MKYPIGIQDFESLRQDGYVYVDKTALVYELATTGRYYFLSRPRRFGKSLLISTLEAYFSGKRELFHGLALDDLETEWKRYPILHLDLNTANYEKPESLTQVLEEALQRWECLYGRGKAEQSLELRFLGIVRRAAENTGERVVILIDEYDKPMLQAIGNDNLQQEYRSTLKAFYSVLKTQDRYIKFAFLTGVTKFGKVSVFSDLNHLNDISMDARFYDLCGISDEELRRYFDTPIASLAMASDLTKEECYDRLRSDFDGYRFTRAKTPGLYNPFSLLNTFYKNEFGDYWFETGTPTFLVELLQKTNFPLNQLQDCEATVERLNSIELMTNDPIPVIYQSGYLSIKDYDKRFGVYHLGFPNREVEKGFVLYLSQYYTPQQQDKSAFFVGNFVHDLEQGNVENFMQRFCALFADSNYQVVGDKELYFQNCMYVIAKMLGFYTEVERTTSNGRIDLIIQTSAYVYIIEMKLDGTADEALKQIENKHYAAPFAADNRQVFQIGINFSSAIRGIETWKLA